MVQDDIAPRSARTSGEGMPIDSSKGSSASPTRVTKLEQQFEHMSGQLSELNEGQQKLTVVVSDIGKKITWALAIASTLWAILQMVGPTLLRILFP